MEGPKYNHLFGCLGNNVNLDAFPRYPGLKNIGLCTFTVLYKFFRAAPGAVFVINDSNKQGKVLLKNRIEEGGEEGLWYLRGRGTRASPPALSLASGAKGSPTGGVETDCCNSLEKGCQQGLSSGAAEQGGFSRTNFSSLKKVDCKVSQLPFHVRLVNEHK